MDFHNKKLVIGLIGAGRIGNVHYKNLRRMSNVQLKTICDIRFDDSWKEKYPDVSNFTTNYQEVLSDPNIKAVLICVPTDLHPQIIKDAALAGKDIFCEKPVGFNNKDIIDAFKTVTDQGVKFQVGFNRRFDKSFMRIVDCRNEGKIGRPQILKITSRDPEPPSYDYVAHSGGIFMDMTIHDFDMARFISGNEVKTIFVSGNILIDDKISKYNDIDTAIINLKFSNGMLGVIDNSRQAVYGYDQRIELFGSNGVALAGNVPESELTYASSNGTTRDNPEYFFLQRYNEAYFNELRSFFGAVQGKHKVACTFTDGIKAIRLAEAAKKSYNTGTAVEVRDIYSY